MALNGILVPIKTSGFVIPEPLVVECYFQPNNSPKQPTKRLLSIFNPDIPNLEPIYIQLKGKLPRGMISPGTIQNIRRGMRWIESSDAAIKKAVDTLEKHVQKIYFWVNNKDESLNVTVIIPESKLSGRITADQWKNQLYALTSSPAEGLAQFLTVVNDVFNPITIRRGSGWFKLPGRNMDITFIVSAPKGTMSLQVELSPSQWMTHLNHYRFTLKSLRGRYESHGILHEGKISFATAVSPGQYKIELDSRT